MSAPDDWGHEKEKERELRKRQQTAPIDEDDSGETDFGALVDDELSEDDLATVLAAAKQEAVMHARKTVRALAALAQDAKAPAPARSSAGGFILRAAGLFSKEAEDLGNKQPHEMTVDDLNRAIKKTQARITARPQGSIFD